jgi:Na+/melibiose symporter-like transporter
MKIKELGAKIKQVPTYVKEHWNSPNEGEYLSLSETAAYTFGQAGIYIFMTFAGIMTFGATYFTGSIMGISNLDFTIIGIMSTVVNYILIVFNPIGVLIYENHGRLSRKMKIFAHIAYTAEIVVGICCYFIPSEGFEFIIKGFPQLIGNMLLIAGVTNYITWIIRRAFSAKHGRLKPFLVICGIPSALIMSIIPYLPLLDTTYTKRLIILHFAFSLMSYFYGNLTNVTGLVAFITPNSQERQRLYSIVPIITGLFPSIINMFLPMLISVTGGYLNLKTYRVFVPIFSFAGILVALSIVKCKERVIEPPIEKRKKVTFFKGAKNVLKNKYFWIINVSNTLGLYQWHIGNLLAWWFIYSLRMEWFSGVAANIVVVGMTVGNLLCPVLTRKFEKRDILILSRALTILMCFGIVLAVKTGNIYIFLISLTLKNTIQPVVDGVSSGLGADVQVYHQWKYGERADSMSGVFSWFLNPVNMVISYIVPYLLKLVGFTSDWDVLYDSEILTKVFSIYTWASIISLVLVTLPFIFYDLTKEKYETCVSELKQRVEDTVNSSEEAAV